MPEEARRRRRSWQRARLRSVGIDLHAMPRGVPRQSLLRGIIELRRSGTRSAADAAATRRSGATARWNSPRSRDSLPRPLAPRSNRAETSSIARSRSRRLQAAGRQPPASMLTSTHKTRRCLDPSRGGLGFSLVTLAESSLAVALGVVLYGRLGRHWLCSTSEFVGRLDGRDELR